MRSDGESTKDLAVAFVSIVNQSVDVQLDEIRDAQLLTQAAAGDSGAFTELFGRYYSMIYHFAYRLCLNAPDAQDVAQETFIKTARSLSSFRGGSSFKNWLYRIAVNAHRDWLRSRKKRAGVLQEFEKQIAESGTERPPAFGPLEQALAGLADDLRQCVVLVYYEGLSHGEAGRVLGCATATVSWRVFRAKQKLKSLLQPFAKESGHD